MFQGKIGKRAGFLSANYIIRVRFGKLCKVTRSFIGNQVQCLSFTGRIQNYPLPIPPGSSRFWGIRWATCQTPPYNTTVHIPSPKILTNLEGLPRSVPPRYEAYESYYIKIRRQVEQRVSRLCRSVTLLCKDMEDAMCTCQPSDEGRHLPYPEVTSPQHYYSYPEPESTLPLSEHGIPLGRQTTVWPPPWFSRSLRPPEPSLCLGIQPTRSPWTHKPYLSLLYTMCLILVPSPLHSLPASHRVTPA